MLSFAAASACASDANRLDHRGGLSMRGSPGLFDVPTAGTVPTGSVDLGFTPRLDREVFAEIEREGTFSFALGLFDFLTVLGRGTEGEGRGLDLRDLSAGFHARVLEQGEYWPSVALGVTDVSGGAVKFHAKYLALSKDVFDVLRLSVGYGSGALAGPFAGLELVPTDYFGVLADYGHNGANLGLRLFPLPASLEGYGLPRPSFDLSYDATDGELVWQGALRYAFGEAKFERQRASRERHRYVRPEGAHELDIQRGVNELFDALVEAGFENVSVAAHRARTGFAARAEIENRRFNRDVLDGLAVAAATAVKLLPPPFHELWIVGLENNVRVLELRMRLDDLEGFLSDELPQDALEERSRISNVVYRPPGPPIFSLGPSARSWLKLDLFVRPKIETLTLTEVGILDYRVSAAPELTSQLWPGAQASARALVPLHQSDEVFGDLGAFEVDRVAFHQAFALPLGPSLPAFGQLSLGLLDRDAFGLSGEILLAPFGGALTCRGNLARIGREADALTRTTATLEAKGHLAAWDASLSAEGGAFLDGDVGFRVAMGRFFGTTEVAAFVRSTTNGNLAGLSISLPLTVGRELPPWRVRPRLPEIFPYSVATTILTENNRISSRIGRTLDHGRRLDRDFLRRERWLQDRFFDRLGALRSSARWLVEPNDLAVEVAPSEAN